MNQASGYLYSVKVCKVWSSMAARLCKNAVQLSHLMVSRVVREGDRVVDATCGNGKDTLFLSQLVGHNGKVYAIDIQENAIERTGKLLDDHGLRGRAVLVRGDHRFLNQYVDGPVRAVMFNLGYLPGGNKAMVTRPDTTVAAVQTALELVSTGGLITLVVYTGHPGGEMELKQLYNLVSGLNQTRFQVIHVCFPNQVNNPPQLIAIQKSGSETG